MQAGRRTLGETRDSGSRRWTGNLIFFVVGGMVTVSLAWEITTWILLWRVPLITVDVRSVCV